MLNHANPALASGSNNGRTLVLLLPSSNPPPWTRMAAGNGPGPSGTCRSSSTGLPPGRADLTSLLSIGAPVKVAAQAIAKMKVEFDIGRVRFSLPSPSCLIIAGRIRRRILHVLIEPGELFV